MQAREYISDDRADLFAGFAVGLAIFGGLWALGLLQFGARWVAGWRA